MENGGVVVASDGILEPILPPDYLLVGAGENYVIGTNSHGEVLLVDKNGKEVHKPGVFKRILLTFKDITWKKLLSFKWWLENIFGNFLISMFDNHDIINYSLLLKKLTK